MWRQPDALYIQGSALLWVHSHRCFAPSTFTFRDVTFRTNHSLLATLECINIQFIFTIFFESTGLSCYFMEKSSVNYPNNMLIFLKLLKRDVDISIFSQFFEHFDVMLIIHL